VKREAKVPSGLYIVAIGASAGGLEALQKLIAHIPSDIKNVAFIVVQHLSPTYKSMLVQTLSSQTKLEVLEAKNKVRIVERNIYVTPPDCEISIRKGILSISKSTVKHAPNPSVNFLFSSLAADQRECAIGVILSGTGSDGTEGIREIKRAGGITIVQNPKSAKYNGMPLAAIDTGVVDYILAPEKIAEQIALLTSTDKKKQVKHSAEEAKSRPYEEVIELLAYETGTDFTNYKRNTLYRRIEKRIAELKLDSAVKYLKYIEKNHSEIEELFSNVLIGVTSFFRDPIVFKALEKKLSSLVDSKADNAPLRVWVPGCATGQEVYSVAMVIADILRKKKRTLPVQIFGTDIDESALITARKAVYPVKSLLQVPADKAKEYFIRYNGSAELSKSIRSMVLFSRHDLTHNPPFLKLDLIVCRNLLIYFNSKLQDYIFPVFFSALNPHGYLLLGKSEGISHFNDLFTTLHRDAKIYQRKGGIPLSNIRYTPLRAKDAPNHKSAYEFSLTDMVKETVFKIFEHPYVVINDNADIKEISGDVSRYLSLRHGQMNANLYKLAHDDLRLELRSLITRCIKENKEAKGSLRKLTTGGSEYGVKITVRPLLYSESPNEFYLVVFEEVKSEIAGKVKPATKVSGANTERLRELELELDATKEDLQTFVERLEGANNELQTINEELQSANEELKISNEELETANEELQSSNEEINIAYAELKAANIALEKQEKLLRQSEVNTNALLNTTMQSFILIDKDYKIIAFNEQAVKIIKSVSGLNLSIGENYQKLISRKEFAAFAIDFKNALKGKKILSKGEITDRQQKVKIFTFNYTPVMNDDGHVECISLSMQDITEAQHTKVELDKSEQLIESVFNTADIGIAIVDRSARILKANAGLCKLLGYEKNELNGKLWYKVAAPAELKEAKAWHPEILAGKSVNGVRKAISRDGKILEVYVTNKLLESPDGSQYIIKTIRNVTESSQYKELLRRTESLARLGGFEITPGVKKVLWTEEMYNIFEVDKDFVPTVSWLARTYLKKDQPEFRKRLNDALVKGQAFDVVRRLTTAKGNYKWLHIIGTPIQIDANAYKLVGTIQDVTAQKEGEKEIERLSWVASHTNSAVSITDRKGKIEWINRSFEKLTGYTLDEVKGKNPGDILQGKGTDPITVKRMSQKLGRQEASTGEVILNYTKSGEPVWISADITPIFKDGELINFIGIMTDLTDLMKAMEMQEKQAGLVQKQQMFDAIAKYFPDGIIGVINQHLNYLFVGGAELKTLGLDHKSLIGDKIFDKLHRESTRYAEPFLRRAFQGESTSFELSISGNDYTVIAVPIHDHDGPVSQVLVVIHNITEQKKTEVGLKKVIEKQKELNDMKTKFVSMASHEFRTPLSTILSSSGLAEKYSKVEDQAKREKHLARIKSSVHNLVEILNDFLILGKIEEGGVRNSPVEVSLDRFFTDILEEMRANLKPDQKIQFDLHNDLDIVHIDVKHFKNVMLNLLSNASKYSAEGKNIYLSVASDKDGLTIKIRDEGIGIPADDQKHLFTNFYRANNVSTIQGTGLGLHIVRKYLDLMGGAITFVSVLDEGTTFTVHMPHGIVTEFPVS
jgi:PAS domain S-box-containing protein